MYTNIVPVQHPLLKPVIQCFIFFSNQASQQFAYQTFPNTNLCLSIYRDNRVSYKKDKAKNICRVSGGGKASTSYIFGFHEQPFNVEIGCFMEQICVLFNPGGLRAVSRIPYQELCKHDQVFEDIFRNNDDFVEQVFGQSLAKEKASMLEYFLLNRLKKNELDYRTLFVLDKIISQTGKVAVHELSAALKINESTLYRLFKSDLGQSPKAFLQTVRFRNTFKLFREHKYLNLTELSYSTKYYDQSHFIKDFKKRSGMLPNAFHNNISTEQELLTWVVKPQIQSA